MLSCADSQVPAEIVFAQGIGNIFDVCKAGVYHSLIKTPTKTGAEVVINHKRVSVKQTAITFIHRNHGYAYEFTPINTDLLQDLVI